ncbi:branched-chain amino acid ABC transporter permease [Deltaproteobacteria bacterium OttesenSCG-928-M10]|nr:branched-chain amino acid ABC transporter permease [Deltaproteobacteria bacterium OttesenSCG-928-M10]
MNNQHSQTMAVAAPADSAGRAPSGPILPRLGMTPLGALAVVLMFLLPLLPLFQQEYLIRWLTVAAYLAAATIAFDLSSGYINIVNFGLMAFAGLGAYTSAILCQRLGLSPWAGIVTAGLSAGALGFFTGVITLRLRGIFAACLAWFVGLALMGLATKLVFLTRGPTGLTAVKLFDTGSNLPYYYTIMIILVAFYVICAVMVRGPVGLAFKAIGQSMDAARTSGINPVFYRILNFTASCAMVGILGGFYAHYFGILTPDVLHTSKTVEVLAISFIGGRASLWGGAVSAFPFLIMMEYVRSSLSHWPGLNLIIYGIILILVMIYYPGGVAALYRSQVERLRKYRLVAWLTGMKT